jgi:predicted RNase H-like HicB family nuclease
MTYTVIYEKGPETWGAYVPDLPGVISVGDSPEEVEQLIHEAVAFHLQGLREAGFAIPPPASVAGFVEIDSPSA